MALSSLVWNAWRFSVSTLIASNLSSTSLRQNSISFSLWSGRRNSKMQSTGMCLWHLRNDMLGAVENLLHTNNVSGVVTQKLTKLFVVISLPLLSGFVCLICQSLGFFDQSLRCCSLPFGIGILHLAGNVPFWRHILWRRLHKLGHFEGDMPDLSTNEMKIDHTHTEGVQTFSAVLIALMLWATRQR